MWAITTIQEAAKNGWIGDFKDVYKQSNDELKLRYKTIDRFCKKNAIQSLGGPALSGALLAHGAALECGLENLSISHKRKRHSKIVDGHIKYPLLMIDDMVETGITMERTLVSLYNEFVNYSISWRFLFGVLVFDYRVAEIKRIAESTDFPLLRHLIGRERFFVLTEKRRFISGLNTRDVL